MIRIFTGVAAAGLFLSLLAGSTAPATAQDATQESTESTCYLVRRADGTLYVMPPGCTN